MAAPGTIGSNPRHGALTACMVICLSITAALAALEIGLRLVKPQALAWDVGAVWEPVAGLGWRNRPGIDVTVNTGERTVRMVTNEFGHRMAERSVPDNRDPDVRILAVGDSFVQALQVEHEATFTALLAERLSRRLARRVDVVNAGVGGWDPNHYLLYAREEIERIGYDMVLVFLFLQNDLVADRIDAFPPREGLTVPVIALPSEVSPWESVRSIWRRVRVSLRQHSHLFVFGENLLTLVRMRSGERAGHMLSNDILAEARATRWETTSQVLREIAAEAGRKGTGTVFVLLPPKHYIYEDLLETYMRVLDLEAAEIDIGQPARLLTTLLAPLAVVDATPALRAAATKGVGDLYGNVDVHFGPAGHQVVASLLERELSEALSLRLQATGNAPGPPRRRP